eukprot:3209615-Prymnesium_polylepis.1
MPVTEIGRTAACRRRRIAFFSLVCRCVRRRASLWAAGKSEDPGRFAGIAEKRCRRDRQVCSAACYVRPWALMFTQ